MRPLLMLQTLMDAGYEPRAYSGRGMYGRQCISVTTGERVHSVLADIIACCEDVDAASDMIRGASTDNMGLDHVIYWPSVTWPEVLANAGED